MEMVMLLAQNPALLSALQPLLSAHQLLLSAHQPSLSAHQPLPFPIESTPTLSSVPPPASQGRSFSRPNRGTGGVLTEKQKISKEITASATKRKSLLDPDVEATLEIAEGNPRQTKRSKATKVCHFFNQNNT